MKPTANYNLHLYDLDEKFSITAAENSLNANMKIIDEALGAADGRIDNIVEALNENVLYTNVLLNAVRYDDINTILTSGKSIGYLDGYRWSGTQQQYASTTGWDVSGLMKAQVGDIIYLKNVDIHLDLEATAWHGSIAFHDVNGTNLTSVNLHHSPFNDSLQALFDENGNIIQFTIPSWGDVYYFSLTCQDINENSIITVNEEIPDDDLDVKFSRLTKLEQSNVDLDSRATRLGVSIQQLEEKSNLLDTKVTKLENTSISDSNNIPDYWKSHLDVKVDEIRAILENVGINSSPFFFYNDAHRSNDTVATSKRAPDLIKYLYKNTSINKVIFGGDIVGTEPKLEETEYKDKMVYLWDWVKQCRDLDQKCVIGNHDDGNETDGKLPVDYIYAYLFANRKPYNIIQGNGFYYYEDDSITKTRYLYLDTSYNKEVNFTEQLTFVQEALQSAPANWHIVCIAHIWFAPDYDTWYAEGSDKSGKMPVKGFSSEATQILQLLDKYNARTSPFTEACKGTVECCIGGHVHIDHVDFSDGGIPVIVTEAACSHDRNGTNASAQGIAYVAGTITESAVSAVIPDYKNNKIEIVRVGRGANFTVDITNKTIINGDFNVQPELPDDTPAYTNVLDTAGYESGYYMSNGNAVVDANAFVTGYIPCRSGDTIYLANITMPDEQSHGNRIACYDANKDYIDETTYSLGTSNASGLSLIFDENTGNLISFKVPGHSSNGVYHIRLSAWHIDETSIITVNEPIE